VYFLLFAITCAYVRAVTGEVLLGSATTQWSGKPNNGFGKTWFLILQAAEKRSQTNWGKRELTQLRAPSSKSKHSGAAAALRCCCADFMLELEENQGGAGVVDCGMEWNGINECN